MKSCSGQRKKSARRHSALCSVSRKEELTAGTVAESEVVRVTRCGDEVWRKRVIGGLGAGSKDKSAVLPATGNEVLRRSLRK
jgi:hypothetical protein